MTDDRPNPDALLAEVQQQEAKQRRGRLKVFFGMAAGVGKTYAMLEEARARAAEGLDVRRRLRRAAHPHRRPRRCCSGMELLPYKIVEYRNAKLKEFDLDAALARKPALICVDELAHTNAPGMRHPKRWQDVVELLDAGINVYTTLNVQHLESVNDIVERITGVKVRETLPDSVLEQADEVELVDIAPEELLERFREGKVYRPEQAERAAKHFFTKGNLIALRELALRTTAQRVDAQMQEVRREAGVRTHVGGDRAGPRLRRPQPDVGAAGARRPGVWRRACGPTGSPRTSKRPRPRGCPPRIGGGSTARCGSPRSSAPETVTLSGDERRRRGDRLRPTATTSRRSSSASRTARGWRDLLFGSVGRRSGPPQRRDRHLRHSRRRDEASGRRCRRQAPAADRERDSARRTSPPALVGRSSPRSAGRCTTASSSTNENILMLYLLGVLWVATHHSRGAAILASVLAVAAFDLIFVPPYLHLRRLRPAVPRHLRGDAADGAGHQHADAPRPRAGRGGAAARTADGGAARR